MEKLNKERIYKKEISWKELHGIWISPNDANILLENRDKKEISISLDANKSKIIINPKQIIDLIGINKLEKIAKSKIYYFFNKISKELIRISIYDDRTGYFYKLYPTKRAPTVEISGIKMHRTKEIDPWEDARQKVYLLNIRKKNAICLDTCMGLGYTALWLSKFCKKVYTVEIDENMIEMTKWNPWSFDLYKKENIVIIKGDVFEVIKEFKEEYFDFILHDPPTIFMAGRLYSKEFYEELFRVLKIGGRMYHYTGYRGEKRGFDIIGKTMQRLNKVGFKTYRKREILGILAEK